MGIVNIVEGSIPIVMNDIVRGIAAAAIGGACGGAVTMVYGADATVPFGGVLMIPTMSHPMAGIMAAGEYRCYRHGLCRHQKRYSA